LINFSDQSTEQICNTVAQNKKALQTLVHDGYRKILYHDS